MPDLPDWPDAMQAVLVQFLGATAHAQATIFQMAFTAPLAVVVGNERAGIRPEVLTRFSDRVRLPMAPGQDSLNVGMAAGVPLYEVVRRRLGVWSV